MNGHSFEEIDNLQTKNGTHTFHHAYSSVPGAESEYFHKEQEREKPWKRVLSEVTKKRKHLYEPVKSVPSPWILLLLGTCMLLAYLTQLIEDDLPSPVQLDPSRDLNGPVNNAIIPNNVDGFNEELAWVYLHQILGEEPRVCGTPHHLKKTRDLKELLDSVVTNSVQTVHTDWQFASGDYWMTQATGHVNCYRNVSNVIAVLEGQSGRLSDGSFGSSVLVNCHYDSVPFALGVSDNAIFCAVMLETLALLSRRENKLRHNIVFLFNGAEENPLQGAHAFLQHPWAMGITTVINLDAAGMNGKSNLFQVTDPRVLTAYRQSVSRPSAQSVGEMLFQSGIVPSDTDFRIWKDFGGFQGVDIAFVKWGHVYHTRYDHPSLVRNGVLQHAGDMLLSLVAAVGDDPDLADKAEPSTAVYWDYLYLFMASYSLTTAHVVDSLILIFALLSILYYVWTLGFRWLIVRELLFSVLGRVFSIMVGVIVTMVFIAIMVSTTVEMRYLTNPWIVVPLYWIPYLVGAVYAAQLCDAWRLEKSGLSRSLRAAQAMCATRILVCLFVFVLLCAPATVTLRYALTLPLAMMSVAAFISLTVIRRWSLTAWQYLLLECALAIPSTMFLFTLALRINALMLPVMGRSMADHPDYTVGVLNLGLAVVVPMTLSGVELLFSRKWLWAGAGALGVASVVLMFVPFSPYSDHGPSTQRHYWFHTEMVSYAQDGAVTERQFGVLLTKHDAYTPGSVLPVLQERNLNYRYRTDFQQDCAVHVFCNLPLYRTRFGEFLGESILLYSGPPAPFRPAPSLTLRDKRCSGVACAYTFTMRGTAHNMVTIWPRDGVNLTSWSLRSPVSPTLEQNGRPVYVVIHSSATYSEDFEPLEMTLNFDIPVHLQAQPAVDVSHHAHKIQHPQDNTPELDTLVAAMPDYFNIATIITLRSNYIF